MFSETNIQRTGYLPTMLQLYATDVFSFGTSENGWLIFMYSMLRGVFLTFAFPKLIAVGRKWTSKREAELRRAEGTDSERQPLLVQSDASTVSEGPKKDQAQKTFTFDLTYTRFSLIADGLLTMLCSFVREGWQMYLVAAVLPFAAGTGSAAKGTVLQMVGSSATSSERTDALAGVSLVENMARLTTSKYSKLCESTRLRRPTICRLDCCWLTILQLLSLVHFLQLSRTLEDLNCCSCVML